MRRRQQGAGAGRWVLLGVLVLLLCAACAVAGAVTWVLRAANSAPALSTLQTAQPGRADRGLRLRRQDAAWASSSPTTWSGRFRPTSFRRCSRTRRSRSRTSASTTTRASTTRASSAPRSRTRPRTRPSQGGSTLTMQLVRLLYTQDDTRGGHRRLQAQDQGGEARPRPRGEVLEDMGRRQVPELGPLRDRRRAVGDRRRRGRAAVLRQARQGPDAARGGDARRDAAGTFDLLAHGQPRGHEGAPQRGAGQDGRARDDHAREGADRDGQGPRPAHGQVLPEGPRALRARLRPVRAGQGVRRRQGQARRDEGLHDDRPRQAARGARGDRQHDGQRRAVVGDRHDRPQERRHRRDGLLADVRPLEGQVDVQPRRPGPSPARLVVQDHGADDRAARRREPEHDDLRLTLADEDRHAGVRRPVRDQDLRRRQRRQHEPRARDAALRQLRLHPARGRPRPGQGQGDGADDGHQVQARRLLRRDPGRPRRTASRRWRWRARTRRSPTAATATGRA